MSFTADNAYGEYNHALSENELPIHSHMTRHYLQGNAEWNGVINEKNVVVTRYGAFFPDSTNDLGSTGYTFTCNNCKEVQHTFFSIPFVDVRIYS